MHLLKIFFLIIVSSHDVLSQYTRFKASVMPIMKDAKTSLPKFSWSFQQWDGQTFFLIDLDAPFTWENCILRTPRDVACGLEEGCRFPLPCDDKLCQEAHSYINPNCPSLNITAKYGCNICAVTPLNPISKSCKVSQLTTDLVHLYPSDGRNPIWLSILSFGTELVLSCAPSSLLKSFPKDVRGVAAFSWSALAFPRQVYVADVAQKFALCLPSSSSSPGVTFFGDGPFYFTSFPNVDLRSFLSYTPMLRKTSKSLGYFIRINRISVKGTPVPLPLLKGSPVRLSTVKPYTILRSDIYNGLIKSFSDATKNIPRVKAVKPFGLCLQATGFRVPNIDLEMESGKIWRISGDNLMKNTGNRAACLAFIDGGIGSKNAVVIGTFQMENNFLFFDLENQKLGFSSSLLARGTSCSSFNSTVINE